MNLPRKGATAVEAAFIIPVVLLFVFGSVEIVRINVVRHTARNAAYEATRTGIVPGASAQEAIETANEVLAICGINDARIEIEPETIVEATQFVTTKIEIPMNTNSWGVGIFARNMTLSYDTTLRTERSPGIQALAIEEATRDYEESQQPDPPTGNSGSNDGETGSGNSNSGDNSGSNGPGDGQSSPPPPEDNGSGPTNPAPPNPDPNPQPDPQPTPPNNNPTPPTPPTPPNNDGNNNPSPPNPDPILL